MIELFLIAVFVLAMALAAYIYFNRSPIRVIPPEKNIVSPADGRIIEVIDLLELKRKKPKIRLSKACCRRIMEICSDISDHCYVILIKNGIFDANIQRTPIGGEVVHVKSLKGKKANAKDIESALSSRGIETLIKSKNAGKIKVIQAAGRFSGKIECSLKANEKILKGQGMGKIMYKGIIIMAIPDYPLKAKKGDKVMAGETVIAVCE